MPIRDFVLGFALMAVCCVVGFAALAQSPQQPMPLKSPTDALGDPLPDGARLRLGTLRFHAPSTVSDMALSPNEETVVTVGDQLIVWDAHTGKERWRVNAREFGLQLPAASYGVQAVAYTADSRRFYTPGRRNEVIVWDVSSGRHEVLPMGRTVPDNQAKQPETISRGGPKAVNLAPNGQKLAVGGADGVIVCHIKGKVLFEIANKPDAPVEANAANDDRLLFGGDYSFGHFSGNGKMLAVASSDAPEEIRLLDSETGQQLRRVRLKARLVRLDFSPDSKQIVATERDNAVRLYDVESGNKLWSHEVRLTNPYENYTSAVAFSPDGKLVATCATDNHIYLLDAATGKELATLSGHTWYPWALAFTADSKLLYSSGWDAAVRRWDITARRQLALPAGVHATGVTVASPDGRSLAYEDDAGSIRLVYAKDGREQGTLEKAGSEYSQLTFSPDGQMLAGGGASGDNVHVTIWDMSSKRVVHRWEWPKGRDPHSTVEALCFTPKGDRVTAAVFRQSAAYIWDLKSDRQVAALKHPEVYGLSFSPDGATLATAGWDSIVRFWETETGKNRTELNVKHGRENKGDHRMYAVCYAPEGGLLATAHLDGKVRIWNAEDMTPQSEFVVRGRFVYGAIGFSPDGLWLATGAMDGSVTLWEPFAAEKIWDAGRHQGYVYTIGFGHDFRTMLSGGDDGVCYLWDLRPPGKQPDRDLARCWDALAGENATVAFQAMWELLETPDRTVTFVAEKLRPVTSVMDTDRIPRDTSAEEIKRLKRLKNLLVTKDPSIERLVTVRRAISVLVQIGTPEAIQLLKELASQDPNGQVGRLAAAALNRSTSLGQR